MTFNISFLSKLVLDIFLPLYSERSRHIKGSKNWNSDINIHCKVWVTYVWYSPQKLESMFFEKYVYSSGPLKNVAIFVYKNSRDFETIIVTSSKLHIFLEFRTMWRPEMVFWDTFIRVFGLWPFFILIKNLTFTQEDTHTGPKWCEIDSNFEILKKKIFSSNRKTIQ